jgi:hypothetical protein
MLVYIWLNHYVFYSYSLLFVHVQHRLDKASEVRRVCCLYLAQRFSEVFLVKTDV